MVSKMEMRNTATQRSNAPHQQKRSGETPQIRAGSVDGPWAMGAGGPRTQRATRDPHRDARQETTVCGR
ncbi:hypothetical protein CSOJ01_08125 [Colletotrichum sojae]|uniref:Uncharacterized protein n=1 Tax=Colletotrichum sojae TaxID=2175907 RepID=A0A8H6J7I1_9PEZI|nr:hypothetical protein CSOJ01_08125 [Colletotrichum sojae]